eukprot:1166919-Rhodomonas_salina.1
MWSRGDLHVGERLLLAAPRVAAPHPPSDAAQRHRPRTERRARVCLWTGDANAETGKERERVSERERDGGGRGEGEGGEGGRPAAESEFAEVSVELLRAALHPSLPVSPASPPPRLTASSHAHRRRYGMGTIESDR